MWSRIPMEFANQAELAEKEDGVFT
jgi:hypothetical protein